MLVSTPRPYVKVGMDELGGLMNLLDSAVQDTKDRAYVGAYLFASLLYMSERIDYPQDFMLMFENYLEVRDVEG